MRLTIFLVVWTLLVVALAHGQTQKNPTFANPAPPRKPHQSVKLPILGRAASTFMSRHPHLVGLLGNINIEYDKPHRFNTEKKK